MPKKLIEILEQQKRANIEKHMPAKDAPVLSDDEKSVVERFQQAWDDHWVDSADKSRLVENDGFHPSSLGISVGKCGRRNVYLLQGVAKEPRFAPRILRVFANGHAVHDRLQKSLESMGIEAKSEMEIKSENPPVRGHADGEIMWEGKRILIEIKSCSDDVFTNRIKWKKPKDEHFEQANIYAYILGIDLVWIIYENKNTQEIKIFEKKADPKAAKKILDKWQLEYLTFQNGELPKRPYKPESPVCAGCDVKYHCFADPEVGVDVKKYKDKLDAAS